MEITIKGSESELKKFIKKESLYIKRNNLIVSDINEVSENQNKTKSQNKQIKQKYNNK